MKSIVYMPHALKQLEALPEPVQAQIDEALAQGNDWSARMGHPAQLARAWGAVVALSRWTSRTSRTDSSRFITRLR